MRISSYQGSLVGEGAPGSLQDKSGRRRPHDGTANAELGADSEAVRAAELLELRKSERIFDAVRKHFELRSPAFDVERHVEFFRLVRRVDLRPIEHPEQRPRPLEYLPRCAAWSADRRHLQ